MINNKMSNQRLYYKDQQYYQQIPEEIQENQHTIQYYDDYLYLHRQQESYYSLQIIKIQPQQPIMKINFYQDIEISQRDSSSSDNKKDLGLKLICETILEENAKLQIKLPLTQKNIEIQIVYNFFELFGRLKMNYQSESIILFDKNGLKKGKLVYKIFEINIQKDLYDKSSSSHHKIYTDRQQNSILPKRSRYKTQIEKIETIRAKIYQYNSPQVKKHNKTVNQLQSQRRRSGYIKSFKKHKKIAPSSIIQENKLRNIQFQQNHQERNNNHTIKERLDIISKNISLKIENQKQKIVPTQIYGINDRIDYSVDFDKKKKDKSFMNIDLVVTNICVTLYERTYGKKYLILHLQPFLYTTDPIHGNHLLWIGKDFNFRNILQSNQLKALIKVMNQEGTQKILMEKSIRISQILQNENQSFYQTYVYNENEQKVGVMIISFEINKKNPFFNKFESRLKQISSQHLQLNKRSKKQKKNSHLYKSIVYQVMPKTSKNLSLRSMSNESKKKYTAGKNIRLSKADRFVQSRDKFPGPGQYTVDSIFKRYK